MDSDNLNSHVSSLRLAACPLHCSPEQGQRPEALEVPEARFDVQ